MRAFRTGLIWSGTLIILALILFYTTDFNRAGVTVAVLDTGVDESHPLLENQVVPGYDFVHFRRHSDDTVGHGTHVAGIIAAMAPEAEIIPIRVINHRNQVKRSWLAILYATIRGADIINMSYAEAFNPATDLAIRLARSKGVVFVASSGNLGVDSVFYPARSRQVYSVTGWDEQNGRIFGNYGRQVNYAAPGRHIRSAAIGGGYTTKSGTSMSAGYFTGVIARLKSEEPGISPVQLEEHLNEMALLVNGPDLVHRTGAQDHQPSSSAFKLILGHAAAGSWAELQSIPEPSAVAVK